MSEPFDFEAFIAGTKLPSVTIPLYRVDHSRKIALLDAEIKRLPEKPGDQREGTKDRRAELVAQRETLLQEQADSATEFELRALSAQEFKDVVQNDEKDLFDQIAAQSKGTRNEAPRETWERVAASVPAMQWSELVTQANELITSKVAVPDFSQSNSDSRKPRTSSES